MGTGASNQVRSAEKVESISITDTGSCSGSRTISPWKSSEITQTSQLDRRKGSATDRKSEKSKKLRQENDKQSAVTSTKTLTPIHSANLPSERPSKGATKSPSSSKLSSGDKLENTMSQVEMAKRIKAMEIELANSESQKMDAQDQLQIFEDKVKNSVDFTNKMTNQETSELTNTINAKDQLIVKLEKDLKASQSEATQMRMKLKRRIKSLTHQLHEVRQESSINQMELKTEISQLKEKLKQEPGGSAPKLDDSKDSEDAQSPNHSKIIVELSNQMSEQSEKIASLEAQLAHRDALIKSLQAANLESFGQSQEEFMARAKANDTVAENTVSGDRLHSSRGSRYSKTAAPPESPLPTKNGFDHDTSSSRGLQSRMSTALSDSDSDWDMDDDMRPQTRSAPARVRIKSAASTKKSHAKDASLQGDDDSSIIQYLSSSQRPSMDTVPVRDARTSEGKTHPHKKSALKNHLEKKKNDSQASSLMGPSIAFASSGGPDHYHGPPSDTSCEPTPRYKDPDKVRFKDPSRLPGFSKLTVVNAGNH